jgi:hypothetical protein
MRQHNLTPLDLILAETSRDLAMWTNDGRLAGDRDPEVRIVTLIDGFLKCNEPCARQIGAPNGEVPLCRCIKIIVGARRSDGASPFRCGRCPDTRSLDLKILRRRFSAVAYDLELDLLAFVECGQTRPLHGRNVHKHILPAALRLDESIAFGRIKPFHSPGRHQSSPRGKRGRPPNLHIPVTATIKLRHITNGLVTLIPANLRNQLSRSQARRVVRWARHEDPPITLASKGGAPRHTGRHAQSMSSTLRHRVLGSLHWACPDDLPSGLRFEYRRFLCEGIDAFPSLCGGLLDDNEFGESGDEEGPCFLEFFVAYFGKRLDDALDVLPRHIVRMLLSNFLNEFRLRHQLGHASPCFRIALCVTTLA